MENKVSDVTSDPVALVGINPNGHPVSVGIYATIDDARAAAFLGRGRGLRYCLWTPRFNASIEAPSAIGLSMPPARTA